MNGIGKRWIHTVSLAKAAVLSAAMAGCGTGREPPQLRAPQPGEAWLLSTTRDQAPVYQATYRWTELPEAESGIDSPETPTVFPLLESETHLDPLQPLVPATRLVTLDEVKIFLRDQWDPMVGGADDRGWNLEEFRTFLIDHGMGWEEFFTLWRDWQASGRTATELIHWINQTDKLAHHDTVIASRQGAIAGGLAVSKFAWDIIKDGAPVLNAQGAFTSILNSDDKDWSHYTGSKRQEWGKFDTLFITGYQGAIVADAEWNVVCYYNAVHPTHGGRYIPSLYVDFDWVMATWYTTFNGGCALSDVVNVSTYPSPNQNPVPEVDLLVKMSVKTLFSAFSVTAGKFRVRGDTGIHSG
ncbi:MAG: hypothetical protein HYU66_29650 [Armatimonadetes bacterium]|nr:hypothetical protein [Armatimonadota bacterium]